MQNVFVSGMLPLRISETLQYQNGVRKLDWLLEKLTARYVLPYFHHSYNNSFIIYKYVNIMVESEERVFYSRNSSTCMVIFFFLYKCVQFLSMISLISAV